MKASGRLMRPFKLSGWAEAMGMKLVKTVGGYVIKKVGRTTQRLEGRLNHAAGANSVRGDQARSNEEMNQRGPHV